MTSAIEKTRRLMTKREKVIDYIRGLTVRREDMSGHLNIINILESMGDDLFEELLDKEYYTTDTKE